MKSQIFVLILALLFFENGRAENCGAAIAKAAETEAERTERIAQAYEVLTRKLWPKGKLLTSNQIERIHKAHWWAYGETGKDGSRASINNYTVIQNAVKLRILMNADAFTLEEAKALADNGVVGSRRYDFNGVSTPAATVAVSNNWGPPREESFYDLIRRNASYGEVAAKYQEEVRDLEDSIRTNRGGSPAWHLENTHKLWRQYNGQYNEQMSSRHRIASSDEDYTNYRRISPADDAGGKPDGDYVLNPHGYWIPRPR